jgi:molybdenum cofactor cytidylyltransferase
VIAGIVLAAGTSSRMGRPKLLLPLAGKPVLQHVLDALTGAPVDEIVVVLGPDPDGVRTAVASPPRTRFVVNDRYTEGQSTSLRTGLTAAGEDVEAAIVLLGDQPGVRPDAIAAVAAAFLEHPQGAAVVQATYEGRPGHPTLLARAVWGEIAGGPADEGAREWIGRNPDRASQEAVRGGLTGLRKARKGSEQMAQSRRCQDTGKADSIGAATRDCGANH